MKRLLFLLLFVPGVLSGQANVFPDSAYSASHIDTSSATDYVTSPNGYVYLGFAAKDSVRVINLYVDYWAGADGDWATYDILGADSISSAADGGVYVGYVIRDRGYVNNIPGGTRLRFRIEFTTLTFGTTSATYDLYLWREDR